MRQAKGDLEGAIEDLDRAIEIDPRYAEAYNKRGNSMENDSQQWGQTILADRFGTTDRNLIFRFGR